MGADWRGEKSSQSVSQSEESGKARQGKASKQAKQSKVKQSTGTLEGENMGNDQQKQGGQGWQGLGQRETEGSHTRDICGGQGQLELRAPRTASSRQGFEGSGPAAGAVLRLREGLALVRVHDLARAGISLECDSSACNFSVFICRGCRP